MGSSHRVGRVPAARRRAAASSAGAVIALVLLVGCASTGSTEKPVSAGDLTTTSSPVDSAGELDDADSADGEGEYPMPVPAPMWDAASRASARRTAVQVMVRFSRRQLSAPAWFAGLRPLLSEQAATAFDGTDPAAVPVRRVIRRAVLEPVGSAYLADVRVRTDVGTYHVLLVREGAGQPWLAQDIRPPSRESR